MNKQLKDVSCVCCNSIRDICENDLDKYFQCMICGHKWMQNIEVDYYQKNNRLPLSRHYDIEKKNKERFQFINNFVSLKKVLEIGCAGGELLEYIKNHNPKALCIGIEPSLDGKKIIDGKPVKLTKITQRKNWAKKS